MMPRTSHFLMANLGSEIARFYRAMDTNAMERALACSERALRIIEELRTYPELRGRTDEIDILSAILQDASSAAPAYKVSHQDLEAYFMPFALRTLHTV